MATSTIKAQTVFNTKILTGTEAPNPSTVKVSSNAVLFISDNVTYSMIIITENGGWKIYGTNGVGITVDSTGTITIPPYKRYTILYD